MNRFFHIEIDTKTDIVSLTALILSIAGLLGQVYAFLQGPNVLLQPPEQITFFSSPSADGQTNYLGITVPLAYVNTGQPGFNDAIKKETLSLFFGRKKLDFQWFQYVESNSIGKKFNLNPKKDAQLVAINAGAVEAHETYFFPVTPTDDYGKNFIKYTDFEKAIQKENEVQVEINFETFSGIKKELDCHIVLNESFKEYIKNGWVSPTSFCVDAKKWF